MGKIVEQKVEIFSGGVTNDPRDTSVGVARMISNFDVLTDPRRMIPYRSSEDGDSASSTSKKQNFCVAIRTGTTHSLYALGVKSASTVAEVLYKDISTGGTNDLGDNLWTATTNYQADSAANSGATQFNLFAYYKKTGYIYGGHESRYIWRYDPSGSGAWVNRHADLTAYTNLGQGLVHSKDDILYVPYDNKIAKNDNGTWTAVALTLPSQYKITSICEYGDYLAIGCAPITSDAGNSRVYLWDRNTSLVVIDESLDWGSGVLQVLEEVDGVLIGISYFGNTITGSGADSAFKHKVIFRYLSGRSAIKFKEFHATSGNVYLSPAKQKINNRIYFMMSITLNGVLREGVWSVGRSPNSPFAVVHERTPNNDTVLVSSILYNFIFVTDYLFQAVNTSSAFAVYKTDNSSGAFTAKSIYESVIFNCGDSSRTKKLIGVTVITEPMPSAGQIVLAYKIDANMNATTYTTIYTDGTNDQISHDAINIESTGANLPEFKEIQFRIESTGNAVVTGIRFKAEFVDKQMY